MLYEEALFEKNGFTMVELLVAMAIMGLLIIMAFPTIRAIQSNNQETKFKEYGKSVLSSAKLYTDSYSDDLFQSNITNQSKVIYLTDIVNKGLIKDINISNTTCINTSNVLITKYADDYSYCLNLKCFTTENTTSPVYNKVINSGSKCLNISKKNVVYKYDSSTKTIEVAEGEENYIVINASSAGATTYLNINNLDFVGWQYNGTIYHPGDILPKITDNVELTIVTSNVPEQIVPGPNDITCKIRFSSSLSGVSGSMSDQVCVAGKACILNKNQFKKNYYTFTNWSQGSNRYTDGENITNKINCNNNVINLSAVFRINQVLIKFNANGGALNKNHGTDYSLNSSKDVLKKTGTSTTDIIQKINYGNSLSSSGLLNYNNSSYLNIYKSGYTILKGKEWNTKNNNSGITYDQAKVYKSDDFCSPKDADCTVKLYANWVLPVPTCTITAARKADSNGWYNDDVKLKLNITGTATSYGIAKSKSNNNGKKTLTVSSETAGTNYIGYVANNGGSNTCKLKIKLDKTPPEYKGKDKDRDSTYNYWYLYYKDKLSGLTKVNSTIDNSRIYYCYGTNSNCSRQCGKSSSHGQNTWKGPDGYYYRKADVDINFIRKDNTKDWAMMETFNTGCQGGKYKIEAWVRICDIAGNCDKCEEAGTCRAKKGIKYRKFVYDFT